MASQGESSPEPSYPPIRNASRVNSSVVYVINEDRLLMTMSSHVNVIAYNPSVFVEYKVWWRTNKSPGDPPSLHEDWWWEKLKFSRLTLEELVRSVSGEEITHLMFHDDPMYYYGRITLVPADLPDEIKHSLKHLIIRYVGDKQEVSNIVNCLSNTRSLESLCLYHVDLSSISDEMRDILMRLKLKHLTLFWCKVTADILTRSCLSFMRSLESLCLYQMDMSSISDEMRDILMRLKLKHLTLTWCEVTADILTSISQMSSLEELNLSRNNLSRDGSLSDKLSTLTSLKVLDLSGCYLTEIPQSISQMKSLEGLNLSGNNLSRDGSLSDKLSTLTSLKRLDLWSCDLTEIPQSISQMSSLDELSLSHNNLSRDGSVIDKLSTLTSENEVERFTEELKKSSEEAKPGVRKFIKKWLASSSQRRIQMMYASTTSAIRASISQMSSLEELDLSQNNLSRDGSLNDKLSTLTSLRVLYLSLCQLTEIPQSVQGMRYLEMLDFEQNQIEFIPEWIGSLASLRELDLTDNMTLKKLHRNICSLPLTELNLSDCDNLSEPPKYVCEGGLENIRQYYTDIDRGSHSMTLASVVVIGRKMAGKTSLIKSLRAKKVVPTYRRDGALGQTVGRAESIGVDETTKVFNFVEICLTDPDGNQQDKTVNVVDFGGDEIYHHAYQLTFRKDCKPIVVVNIIQYEEESQLFGRREATRRVLFDWLAHLYLACPQLDRPLLVLTHRDLAGQRFAKLKEELMTTMTELYREMLQDESLDKNMKIMMSTSQGSFFLHSEIFEIDHLAAYGAVYAQLENVLYKRVSSSEIIIPSSWKEIMDNIKNRQQSHVTTREMFAGLRGDSRKRMMVILDFMRRSGQILWYKSEEDESVEYEESDESEESAMHPRKLADIIFHDVSKVTDMIKTLFNHSSVESKSMLEKTDMERMWQTNPSDECPQIPTDIAIKLLTKFNLIYGPTTVNHNPECYLIPYFMKKHQFRPSKADINLQGEMAFIGLSIPLYAYQQMTVSFLKLIQQSKFDVHAFGNGASGRHVSGIGAASEEKTIEAQLVHEPENQKVITLIQGGVSQVHRCWELFLNIMKTLSDTVKSAWPASLVRYDIICPHCLLLEDLNPEKRCNPGFMTKAISSHRMKTDYRDDCRCRHRTSVPSPLRYPCGVLQQQDMLSLVCYIRSIQPDEQQEIVRLMEERVDGLYSVTPTSQTALHLPLLVENVYKMTNTRGRALIINNRDGDITAGGGGRRGSDKDYTNMKNMLESFGFIISNFSRDGDWTSHDIVKAVHQETQLIYQGTTSVHEGLGMFVLVIMSHGDTGTIVGCDGKHVNLVDIYKLLASQYFPAMRGKPKLVILQACSGERVVRKRRASQIGIGDPPTQNQPTGQQNQQTNQQPGQLTVPQQPTQSLVETNIDHGHETIDDLLVMKPSFDEHKSYRINEDGSYFIGALVAAFYRYAGVKDLCTLSQMIQDVVRKEARIDGVEQVPVTISTFTNGRKLYLSPGVNMRTTDHPDSFTSRELPPPERQRISLNWRDDKEVSVRNHPSIKKKIVHFEVVRNN